MFLFLIVPSLLHIDFVNKFFHGTVYIEKTKEAILVGWEQITLDFDLYDKYGVNGFRFGDIKNGIDYYLVFFSIAILLIEMLHTWSIFLTGKLIFAKGANIKIKPTQKDARLI